MLAGLFSFLAHHTLGTVLSVLALLGTALVTYARDQIRAGTTWALAPLTRTFPWNVQIDHHPRDEQELISDFSLVEVFLCDADGQFARYRKTSSYVVISDELGSYQEGVTTEGYADAFMSMRGAIAKTEKEHGFYISRIDLTETLSRGSRFTNVYAADLHNCFTKEREHWTQELAFRTKHLSLHVHFPNERPPKLIKCKTVEGTVDKPLKTAAKIVELYGKKSIVWEIMEPQINQVLKLEWRW